MVFDRTFATMKECLTWLEESKYAPENEPLGPVTAKGELDTATGKLQTLDISYTAVST